MFQDIKGITDEVRLTRV